jgi:hypothetical protein
VKLPGVKTQEGNDEGIPIEDALTIMQCNVEVADLTNLAAELHAKLCMEKGRGGSCQESDLLGYFVYVLVLFKAKLSEAEDLFHSDRAIKVEGHGWQLPRSLASMRVWRDGLSHFALLCQKLLISAWMEILSEHIEKCKTATPYWAVAFEGDNFNLPLAVKVLKNKLAVTVKAHNRLHGLLQELGIYSI